MSFSPTGKTFTGPDNLDLFLLIYSTLMVKEGDSYLILLSRRWILAKILQAIYVPKMLPTIELRGSVYHRLVMLGGELLEQAVEEH